MILKTSDTSMFPLSLPFYSLVRKGAKMSLMWIGPLHFLSRSPSIPPDNSDKSTETAKSPKFFAKKCKECKSYGAGNVSQRSRRLESGNHTLRTLRYISCPSGEAGLASVVVKNHLRLFYSFSPPCFCHSPTLWLLKPVIS